MMRAKQWCENGSTMETILTHNKLMHTYTHMQLKNGTFTKQTHQVSPWIDIRRAETNGRLVAAALTQ